MELLFSKIKQLITPQFSEEGSNLLMIDEAALAKMTDTIIAGLFVAFLVQGDTTETKNLFNNFVSNLNDDQEQAINPLDCSLRDDQKNASTALADLLFLNQRNQFISLVIGDETVDEKSVETLLTTLTHIAGLYFGKKLEDKEYTITGLLAQIYAERDLYLGFMPLELLSLLKVSSSLAIGHNLSSDAKVASHMLYIEIKNDAMIEEPEEEPKESWWKWFSSKAAL